MPLRDDPFEGLVGLAKSLKWGRCQQGLRSDGEEVRERSHKPLNQMKNTLLAAAIVAPSFLMVPQSAMALGLGSLIEAAVGVPVSQPARRRIENSGEDYLVDPVTQVTSNQAAARGASRASGGNGTVVQGEGNVVNTQQVTHVHHHHYTTNNSEVNVNQPHRY